LKHSAGARAKIRKEARQGTEHERLGPLARYGGFHVGKTKTPGGRGCQRKGGGGRRGGGGSKGTSGDLYRMGVVKERTRRKGKTKREGAHSGQENHKSMRESGRGGNNTRKEKN